MIFWPGNYNDLVKKAKRHWWLAGWAGELFCTRCKSDERFILGVISLIFYFVFEMVHLFLPMKLAIGCSPSNANLLEYVFHPDYKFSDNIFMFLGFFFLLLGFVLIIFVKVQCGCFPRLMRCNPEVAIQKYLKDKGIKVCRQNDPDEVLPIPWYIFGSGFAKNQRTEDNSRGFLN